MKKVLLFLAQGFEEYEAAVFTDVLGWSKDLGLEPVEVLTVGLREEIKATWNFTVKPESLLSEINPDEYDAIAVPGGFEECDFYEDAYNEEFLSFLREFNDKKKPIASVCVGALPLGKSGILKNRKGTTYHLTGGKRRKQLSGFGVEVQDKHVVVDENIITSSSPSTALDVAFTFLEMLTSKENVEKVKIEMGFIRK